MLQTFSRPAFLSILQSFTVRYALLFAMALFTVVMSPSISNYVSNYVANSSWLSGQAATQSEQLSSNTNYAVSLTHQEPNFYQ
jgi:NADH:ubiquinone oxidoreductase subunit 3 (subunit A)